MANLEEFEKKSYYELLGVEPSASLAEIKEAYREIARVYHPDSNFFDDLIDTSLSDSDNTVFRLVTAAYNTLIKETDRKAYDEKLQGQTNYSSSNQNREQSGSREKEPVRPPPRRSRFGVVDDEPQSNSSGSPYCNFGRQSRFQAEHAREQEEMLKRVKKTRINLALLGGAILLVGIALLLSFLIFN